MHLAYVKPQLWDAVVIFGYVFLRHQLYFGSLHLEQETSEKEDSRENTAIVIQYQETQMSDVINFDPRAPSTVKNELQLQDALLWNIYRPLNAKRYHLTFLSKLGFWHFSYQFYEILDLWKYCSCISISILRYKLKHEGTK